MPKTRSWVTLNEKSNDKIDIIDTKQPTTALLLVKKMIDSYKIAIRIYNCDRVNIVLPNYSRSAYIKLKANGAKNVEYIEFPGVGHDSWTSAFAEPDFLKWLFAQKQ